MPLVDLKNIYVNFGKEKILDNISFNIDYQKIITLIGPNGAVEQFMHLNINKHNKNIIHMLKQVHSEHLLKQSVHSLSCGELQKILLARVLLTVPHLLVLDEPDHGLDMNGQILLYQLINKIHHTLSHASLLGIALRLVMSSIVQEALIFGLSIKFIGAFTATSLFIVPSATARFYAKSPETNIAAQLA
uniref:ABC transporter domain-containing protein n=1 Tax=Glossina palpalis gambiensis TaxID=67801 RepID=A0A1B0C784_9MUSC